ncbi:MAG: hypothetical protein R3C01_04095 [Planctomycetaceae bacterium]
MSTTHRPAGTTTQGTLPRCFEVLLPMLLLLSLVSGCSNITAIGAKMLFGDPKVAATFRQSTGVDLEKGEKTVAIFCQAPYSVTVANDSIKADIQDQLRRRMTLRGIKVADPDDVANALDDLSERSITDAIAKLPDVDYIILIQMDKLSYTESDTSPLLRGRSQGVVQVFEVRRPEEGIQTTATHTIEVLRQEYQVEFPRSHPAPSSQMTHRDFSNKFLQYLADDLGHHFYDVPTSELYNHDFD